VPEPEGFEPAIPFGLISPTVSIGPRMLKHA